MAPAPGVEVEVTDGGGRGRGGGAAGGAAAGGAGGGAGAAGGGGAGGGAALSLEDCRCPVCLEIFMEPVTLPCTHTFCKSCFLESVDKATLCCPLCRKRVSTWARMHSRNNTLVDQALWTQIQTCFPLQCQRRLSGQDVTTEDDPGVSLCFPRVSRPGELRQEYEDQVTKLAEEKRALDEEERRASEEYIQRLLAEEEQLQQEDRRRREEDERLARLLSSQLNSAVASQENLRPADVTPAKKKKEVTVGQMDRFLCPRPSKSVSSGSASSFTANKENILLSQTPPQVDHLLPQLDYYGPQTDCDAAEPPKLHPASSLASEEEQLHLESLRSHLTRDGEPSSAKRKSSELETTKDEEATLIKRVCHSLPSSCSSSLKEEKSVLQGVAEWETELLSRRQQEEEDRRLALLLQKELDQEEKQRATDRRKGSSDAYLLRQSKSNGKEEASSSDTASRASRKTPKTTTSSSSSSSSSSKTPKTSSSSIKTAKASLSSSSRGSKQATLTEMFSSC